MADIVIEGLDKLVNKLNRLGYNTDKLIDTALRKGAVKIQADAKLEIERLDAVDTGRLEGSISVEKIPKGYEIGTNVHYAPYIEFGTGTAGDPTVPHTQRTRWKYMDEFGNWHWAYAMKPRPFMKNAFNKNKQYVIKTLRQELFNALKKDL